MEVAGAAPDSFNEFPLLQALKTKYFPRVLCTSPLTGTMPPAAGAQVLFTARGETYFRGRMDHVDPHCPLRPLQGTRGTCPRGAARASPHETPSNAK